MLNFLKENGVALSAIFPCHHNSVHECPGWCSQEYRQCWKDRQTPGSYQAVLQSHRPDEAWLHWWIWNHWWPQSWEKCSELHWQVEQVRSNQLQIWCVTQRSRKMAEQPASFCHFGVIVLTASGGITDHEEARQKHTGGKTLGFFF